MATTQVPLTGADFILHALGRYWRRIGGTNNATLAVECIGRLDAARVQRALARFLAVCPWPAARLHRPFPWSVPHWRVVEPATGPVVRTSEMASLDAALAAELNAPIDPEQEPPVRLAIVALPGGERSALVLTWYHSFMDPRGAENLVAHLAELDATAGTDPWSGAPPAFVVPEDPRSIRVRGPIAMKGIPKLREFRADPPVSLGRGRPPAAPIRVRTVARREGTTTTRASRELTFRLAVVGRVLAPLFARRGLRASPYLVPVSVDRRLKGEVGPVVGNYLGVHFARFTPSTDDPESTAQQLRRQLRDAVRENLVEANWVGMDLMRSRPLRVVWSLFGLSADADITSFQCADTGKLAVPRDSLLGCPIVNGYHAPAVHPRPGLGVFFNRRGPHRNVTVAWMEGVVDDAEVDALVAAVSRDLGWEA